MQLARCALIIGLFLLLGLSLTVSSVDAVGTALKLNPNKPHVDSRVMILVFNPIIESHGGRTIVQLMGWNDPFQLSSLYQTTIEQASGGYVRYHVIKTIVVDGSPAKTDGHIFTDEEYLQCLAMNPSNPPSLGPECGLMIDYPRLLKEYGVCEMVNKKKLSELWLWGGPWHGFWEANQAGAGAIWTNGPTVTGTDCKSPLDIMGFNYERGLPEMLESMGHRFEGNMVHVYGGWASNMDTPWNSFTLLDRDAPGMGGCGTAHNAVNASPGTDYDRSNPRTVASRCDDFLNYPHLTGKTRLVNCYVWGCEAGGYLIWWLSHMPRARGTTDGKLNNWWAYVLR